MTKDDCLLAISNAFGGVQAESTVGYFNVRVSTVPPCEVILTNEFVAAHIDQDGMTPDELTERIKATPKGQWSHDRVPCLPLLA